jgi:site-specific DNA-methyltransferase (adenine-specific)
MNPQLPWNLPVFNIPTDYKPDILDCLSNLSSDEVFTPPKIANRMLDALPSEVWCDPSLRFLDPACKSGVFLRECAKRLMEGLKNVMPDETARREHILKHMLYGIGITEITALMSRRTLYCAKDATSPQSVVMFNTPEGNIWYERCEHTFKNEKCSICKASSKELDRGDGLENYAYGFLHNPKVFNNMKFDVIIGNPPYQLKDGGHGASASPIYHLFVEQAIKMNPRYISFIIPARWYAGGKGLDTFRAMMLKDKRIKTLVDYPNPRECFPNNEIKGGVSYFLWDADYKGECEVITMKDGVPVSSMKRYLAGKGNEENVFVRHNEAIPILQKVKALKEPTMDTQVSSTNPFGLRTFFEDFVSNETNSDASTPPPAYILDSEREWVKIYANSAIGWVEKKKVQINQAWLDRCKVLISMAYGAGEGYPHQIIGKPIVTPSNTCCTETYLVCGIYNNETQAKNMDAYLRTRFLRFLVSLRKNTQHITKERFAFVPQLDMTQTWTDEKLYARYGLNDEEIAFIESMIKEMPQP